MSQAVQTPDQDLMVLADVVTLWVASRAAPKEFWSLREALIWANAHADKARLTLFRPPSEDVGAIWIKPDQIERLALHLTARAA